MCMILASTELLTAVSSGVWRWVAWYVGVLISLWFFLFPIAGVRGEIIRWRQRVPPKHRQTSTTVYGVTSQMTAISIVTLVRTSDLTKRPHVLKARETMQCALLALLHLHVLSPPFCWEALSVKEFAILSTDGRMCWRSL
jgi:hypothetical protein